MAIDPTLAFCTIDEIAGHARFEKDDSQPTDYYWQNGPSPAVTIPSLSQVERFAQEIASEIVLVVRKSGGSYEPPRSGFEGTNPHVATVLSAANAIGAAWLAVRATPGDDEMRDLEQELKDHYYRYIGDPSDRDDNGLIGDALAETESAGSLYIHGDAHEGEVEIVNPTRARRIDYENDDDIFRVDDPE